VRSAIAARPVAALAVVAAACSAALLLILMHPLTFSLDEWDFLVDRRAWTLDSFLSPHREHISVIPVAVYKVLVTAFGMTSQAPFQVALTLCAAACVLLVWTYVRRRLGDWLAFAAILPLLFLGSGAINLIWPFQLTLMSSLALGLGALVALDRGDRRGDRIACGLLTGSVISGSPGLPFVLAITVAVLIGADRGKRAYIFLIPAGLYAVWWVGWGVGPADPVTLSTVVHLPVAVFNGYASSVASVLGLTVGLDGDSLDPLTLGRPLLVICLALAAYRVWRLGRVPSGLLPVLALGMGFWTLLGLVGTDDPNRPVTSGRYQYLGAVFVILAVAELYRGVRPGRTAIAAVLVIATFAVVGNLRAFDSVRDFLDGASSGTRINLGAAEIAGDAANPDAEPVLGVTVGPYLDAVAEYGSPAYSEAEIVGSDEFVKVLVDRELETLEAIAPLPAPSPAPVSAACVSAEPAGPSTVSVGPGAIEIEPAADATLGLRRYATGFPIDLGSAGPGRPVVVTLPNDDGAVRWTLAIDSRRPARVCTI
jgi:hypothetical protein